jgi:magnesium transporter
MRLFRFESGSLREGVGLQDAPPAEGFDWITCTHDEFRFGLASIQDAIQSRCGTQLVDLHVSDLLNLQLSSRHDYTSQYDLVIFRRLATATHQPGVAPQRRTGPVVLRHIDTAPVGCVVFDRLLLTVHPEDCPVHAGFIARLLHSVDESAAQGQQRMPLNAADLMLRLVSFMVDGYLSLRRDLSRQLDHWQAELLSPRTRFSNWSALVDARLALHGLDEVCEDQRTAIQDWITSVESWPLEATPAAQRDRDLLRVRSRDVLEHIERVVRHVQRLETNIETTVQMHFNSQSHRTSETMRTLTAITAVFLPLNLITGFFGMNFEFLPLVHRETGIWWAIGIMTMAAIGFVGFLWRKRYLARSAR